MNPLLSTTISVGLTGNREYISRKTFQGLQHSFTLAPSCTNMAVNYPSNYANGIFSSFSGLCSSPLEPQQPTPNQI